MKNFLNRRRDRRSATLYALLISFQLTYRFLEKSPKLKNAKDLFLDFKKNILL